MIQGLPKNFDFITPNSLIMLDDLMSESADDKTATNLFIRGAHHSPCFVIKTCQNLFPKGSESRTQTINTQYIVLFKNPVDKLQIQMLERHMYPSSKQFLQIAYDSATRRPHSYLFIDLHKETPEHVRVRARILPHERPMVAHVDKRLYADITTSKFLKEYKVSNPQQRKDWDWNGWR